MGTLPPAIFQSDISKLPFGRIVELSMEIPEGLDVASNEFWEASAYGPCPLISIPLYRDDIADSETYYGRNEPDPSQTFIVPESGSIWDRSRRIECWNNVTYDYTTNNSQTGLSGTGPRLYKDVADGQIVISAPEDRPVPYVTWLNLGVGLESVGPGANEDELRGRWTDVFFLLNFFGCSVGIIRHSLPNEKVDYSIIAHHEIKVSVVEILQDTVNLGPLVDENLNFVIKSQAVAALTRQSVSLFAFDVVPPNQTFIVESGWQAPVKNDWSIVSLPRDFVSVYGAYRENPESVFLDKVVGKPNNRFGVMTF